MRITDGATPPEGRYVPGAGPAWYCASTVAASSSATAAPSIDLLERASAAANSSGVASVGLLARPAPDRPSGAAWRG